MRMMGDFDGSANALWTLYGKEAKSYDNSRIQTLKDDMDGVLIFVRSYLLFISLTDTIMLISLALQAGLFSAALTSFIIDSKQNLTASPSDRMVYYLQQNVALLSRISEQIYTVNPQATLPLTPPPPFPAFEPPASDVRINTFWFMSLVFSLSAALLAILVQQWVRDYMHVFQQYSDPLKSARLRQYLHDGCEGWYMPAVAEAIPGLLHLSLFLFFVGLCDSILRINTAIGLSTTLPVGIVGLLYIFTTFAPVIFPNSPYRNSFSILIWYLAQELSLRRYKDRNSDGATKSVSPNMAQGQMQLAMEETEGRKRRDERGIRWLLDNLIEDPEAEITELFLATIPGSFNGEWGEEVWKEVFEVTGDEGKRASRDEYAVEPWRLDADFAATPMPLSLPSRAGTVRNLFKSVVGALGIRKTGDSLNNVLLPAPGPPDLRLQPAIVPIRGEDAARKLSRLVAHTLDSWRHRGLSETDGAWRARLRACIETIGSLVCLANTDLDEFGDIVKLLGDIGGVEKTHESSLVGTDESFVKRWTCLSLMVIRRILVRDELMQYLAWNTAGDLENREAIGHRRTLTGAQMIDKTFDEAWGYIRNLHSALYPPERLTDEQVKQTIRHHEHQISALERISTEADSLKQLDWAIFDVQSYIGTLSCGITTQLPGVQFDKYAEPSAPVPFSQFGAGSRDPLPYHFILPAQKLKSVCSIASTFRNILQGQWDPEAYMEMKKNLEVFDGLDLRRGNPLEQQLWRLQDLQRGGFGFTVELFFLTLKQLLSTSSSKESRSSLYIYTFRNITSQWRWYKDSLGTQKLLLDMVTSPHCIISNFDYPDYITDELLVLLGNVFEGQTGPHIDSAVQWLTQQLPPQQHLEYYRRRRSTFWAKALGVITRVRARSS